MIGQSVAHYRIVDRIGAGGMGVVYRAEDLRLGRVVALKFLSPELSSSPTAVERFLREARTASSLNHPNICTIYSIEESDGQRFLAMELLEGRPLNEVIDGRPMPTDTVIDLGLQIADALDAAHSQGVLHRDIKPANIFVTRRGLVKVLDFGLAKMALLARDSDAQDSNPTMAEMMLTTQGLALGTVAYMSPEQARGEALDARSDIFSFGIVLYEMVTGQQAFSGRTSAVVFDAILNREPPAPSLFHADLPADLEDIVIQALDKDRVGRFQSMAELRAELARLKRERQSGQFIAASAAGSPSPSAEGELSTDDTPTLRVRRPRSPAASDEDLPAASKIAPIEPAALSTSTQAHPPVAPAPVPPDPAAAPALPAAAAAQGRVSLPSAARSSRVTGTVLTAGVVCVLLAGLATVWFWRGGRIAPAAPDAHGAPSAPVPGAATPPVLATSVAAQGAIASAPANATPGDVSGAAPAAKPARPAPARATAPAVRPVQAGPLPAAAAAPVLPRVSPQRVDPGGLLLSEAHVKFDAKLFDQARADLQSILRDYASSAAAPGAWLLRARIDSQQGQLDEAISALSSLRSQFPDNAANAEGSVLLGQLLERSKRPDRVALARQVLADVPLRFAASPWAPRALAQRALLETRERVKGTDPSLGTVPAAFLSNRMLIEQYPAAPEAEFAFWQVATEYEDRKLYDRAATAFADLATRFPQTRRDAWWRAAELYDKRLKDAAAARAAYARVPPESPKYKDAQKRAAGR